MVAATKSMLSGLLVLAVLFAVGLVLGFWHRSEVEVLKTQNNRLQGDVEALNATVRSLQEDAQVRTRIDTEQSTDRSKRSKAVQDVRDELRKEEVHATEPRPVGTAEQLSRLRRLTDAANSGIRASRELP